MAHNNSPYGSINNGLHRFVPPIRHGEIQLVLGPMFSGKTTELIRRLKRWRIANCRCLLVKYAKDNRYTTADAAATHDNQTLAAVPAVSLQKDIGDRYAGTYDVFGIDEGQFFPDLVEFCEDLANRGKVVVVAALDGSYKREGFDSILQLIPKAEDVVKLRAVCVECYGDASFTKRKIASDELELIGGQDAYSAVCRQCFLRTPPIASPCGAERDRKPVVEMSPLKRNSNELLIIQKAISNKKLFTHRKSDAEIEVEKAFHDIALNNVSATLLDDIQLCAED